MSETLEKIVAATAAKLHKNVSEIDVDAPIEALGIDSLDAIELMFDLEEALGKTLPDGFIEQGMTPRKIAERLEALAAK
ncbi:MAG: acyl carrier protein [Nitrospirae bacterium]|nr:acyl carrier protein [Nitrospirota bacterium]